MESLDFKDIREQISEMAECYESYEDFDDIDDNYFYYRVDKYRFSGEVIVNGKSVYASGEYRNDFDMFELSDFSADDEDLQEYLENYEINEIEYQISRAS